eukprot:COSAG04_NODE_18489_length_440_cov_0.903226_2_plen_52_part_01
MAAGRSWVQFLEAFAIVFTDSAEAVLPASAGRYVLRYAQSSTALGDRPEWDL